jgi:hypothetical protein
VFAFLATAALLTAAPCRADGAPRSRDLTEAEKLFKQGRALLEEGKTEAACAAFERSFRLDATGGTMLNLADCHERIGRRAEAYREFLKTAELGDTIGWAELAQEGRARAEALASSFPKLTVTVAEPVKGLFVSYADVRIAGTDLGKPLPVPPGTITVVAEAPGYERYTTTLTLAEEDRTVVIPALAAAHDAAPAAPPAPAPVERAPDARAETRGSSGWAPWVVVGVGGAMLGASVFTGVAASRKHSDLEDACPTPQRCPEGLESTRASGKTLALVTDVLWIGGAAAVGGGLLWHFLSPEGDTAARSGAVRLAPAVGADGASASVAGRF